MRSYNYLWDELVSDNNIEKSIFNSSKGKRNRKIVKVIFNDIPYYIPKIKKYATNFKNSKHHPIEIYDGISRKKRTIIVPKYPEQIIHHMVVNTMMPIFFKGMYQHSYGSIPNRGLHKGKKYIEK